MKPLDQSYSKSRRFKNQVKAVVTNPYNVIVLVAIVLLTYLIVLPLVDMLSTTFQLAQRDLRATGGTMADVGKFTCTIGSGCWPVTFPGICCSSPC